MLYTVRCPPTLPQKDPHSKIYKRELCTLHKRDYEEKNKHLLAAILLMTLAYIQSQKNALIYNWKVPNCSWSCSCLVTLTKIFMFVLLLKYFSSPNNKYLLVYQSIYKPGKGTYWYLAILIIKYNKFCNFFTHWWKSPLLIIFYPNIKWFTLKYNKVA